MTEIDYKTYKECTVICDIKRKKVPITTEVPVDEFTEIASKNFDYTFDGISKFYPYELPNGLTELNFEIMCIVGASGSGKSTLLKEFSKEYRFGDRLFDGRAVISNFETPEIAAEKLASVGINSIPVWCRPRRVLSVGEGFRADLALNLDNNTIFDEFTSTIDRNVAKSTCNGIQKYIRRKGMKQIVFSSCHNDFIPFLKPDIVIDLDEEKVYDCRGESLGEILLSKYTKQQIEIFGEYLGSITI